MSRNVHHSHPAMKSYYGSDGGTGSGRGYNLVPLPPKPKPKPPPKSRQRTLDSSFVSVCETGPASKLISSSTSVGQVSSKSFASVTSTSASVVGKATTMPPPQPKPTRWGPSNSRPIPSSFRQSKPQGSSSSRNPMIPSHNHRADRLFSSRQVQGPSNFGVPAPRHYQRQQLSRPINSNHGRGYGYNKPRQVDIRQKLVNSKNNSGRGYHGIDKSRPDNINQQRTPFEPHQMPASLSSKTVSPGLLATKTQNPNLNLPVGTEKTRNQKENVSSLSSNQNPSELALRLEDGCRRNSRKEKVDSASTCEDKENKETHIIFTIDCSSSMNEKDVRNGKSRKLSRWDAVFQCTKTLLTDQITKESDHSFVVSLVVFNDTAKTLLARMPLIGDAEEVFNALDKARTMNVPKGGTGFSAGLGRASDLAILSPKGTNVVVIFLSDGRPGDLNTNPPLNATEPMQTTFRRCQVTYPAAGVHIERMKNCHGDSFSFQVVCIYDEGRPWLQYLANRYNGTFHAPDLSLENDTSKSDEGNKSPILPVGDDGDSLQIVNVKSQTTILRERFNNAKASGQVISLVGTTTMKDTFQTISSAITSLRTGSKIVKVERQIVLEENEKQSSLHAFNATRMVLDSTSGKISVVNGEKSNSRCIKIAQQPFAQGGLRNVYRMYEMQDGAEISLVGKESRHKVHYNERLKFHIETSSCQLQASDYARLFNEKVVATPSLLNVVKPIQVLTAEVYRLCDPQAPGKFRYLAVEKRIDGHYEKWNGNNGYVHGDTTSYPFKVAQAFSHFSYEVSGQTEMVVDIQGSDDVYTDPQLHSLKKKYGRADCGSSGFNNFFKTHECNFICKALALKNQCHEC